MYDPHPRRWLRAAITLAASVLMAVAAPFVALYRLGRSWVEQAWPGPTPEPQRPVLTLQASVDYLRRQLRRDTMQSFQRYRMFPSV